MRSGSSSSPRPPSTPAPDAAELARALAARIDELVGRLHARLPPSISAWFAARPELVEANLVFTRDSILAELSLLADGAGVPDALPEVDAALARLAAQLGAPLEHLLWGYRNGHRVQWEGWLELVEPIADPIPRRALLDHGSAFFFSYVDRMSDLVTAAYTDERERALRGREQRRMQAVNRVLDGQPPGDEELARELDGWHVGAIAWGPQGDAALRSAGVALERRALVMAVGHETWWGWLSGRRPLAGRLAARLGAWSPPPGTRVALGDDAQGATGFAASHRQAAAAGRRPAPLSLFDDVALEALGSADPDAARRFCARELAGLDGDDARSANLRATLRAWFAHGQNAAATAAALRVHEQTVAQRLRAVEDRVGRPPAQRRAELETALRLLDHLG